MKRSKTYPLELYVNGVVEKTEVSSEETLLRVLRERLGYTDVKEGCGKGDCGSCAVLLNNRPVNACLTLAKQAHGQNVTTLKGIGTSEEPHPLQVTV
jgi:aerobic-type carbon monoxide dehydrogenase small subunit (CoxS/CutS family)